MWVFLKFDKLGRISIFHVLWKRKNNDTEVTVFTVDNFEILQVFFRNSSTDSNIHIVDNVFELSVTFELYMVKIQSNDGIRDSDFEWLREKSLHNYVEPLQKNPIGITIESKRNYY